MAAGATVKTLADVFSKGVTDQDWLIGLSAHDWVVLTKDKNIRRRPNEFEAFAAAGLRVFVITATNLTGEENGRILVKALPKILRLCKNYRPPFVAGITRMSEVTLLDLQRFGLIVTRKKGR